MRLNNAKGVDKYSIRLYKILRFFEVFSSLRIKAAKAVFLANIKTPM